MTFAGPLSRKRRKRFADNKYPALHHGHVIYSFLGAGVHLLPTTSPNFVELPSR
jgi:hypothetical protein